MNKHNIHTFIIILLLSFILAMVGRYARMILVTYPMMISYFPILENYLPSEALTNMRIDILVYATIKVVAIDTIINSVLLYSYIYLLRIFAKPSSIISSLKLYKFFKGDNR